MGKHTVLVFRKQESIPIFLACPEIGSLEKAFMETQSAYPRGMFSETPTALIQKRDTNALPIVGCNRNTAQ